MKKDPEGSGLGWTVLTSFYVYYFFNPDFKILGVNLVFRRFLSQSHFRILEPTWFF